MTREEAIERIKARFDKWALDDEDMKAIQTLVPELRESEDERIIRAIIDALYSHTNSINLLSSRGYQMGDIEAWLEKQKECLADNNKTSTDEDEGIRKLLMDYFECIKSTLSDGVWKGFQIEDILAYLERQKEQKSAECEDCAMYLSGNCIHPNGKCENVKSKQEWGDEDKEALDMCLDAIPKRWKTKSGILLTKWLKDNIHLQLKQEWSEDYREEDIQTRFAFYTYKDDLGTLYLSNVFVEEASRNHGFGTRILIAAEKVAETIGATTISLKVKQDSPANAWYRKNGYGYVAFEDGYDWLEKNLEYMKPNKQEWSEEDEKMIETICKEGDLKPSEQHWLKSLRPSWKPSKEQMDALRKLMKYAVSLSSYYDIQKEIESLYNDLNKLK